MVGWLSQPNSGKKWQIDDQRSLREALAAHNEIAGWSQGCDARHESPMNDALIGYSGFVGGNLARHHRFAARFNSTNIGELRGQSFRRIVHAGTPAIKWWANEHP